MKNIVICADGTWNGPEPDSQLDTATNVLKLARAIAPFDDHGRAQVVFYDWGVGSDCQPITGGAFGRGLDKNVQDCYRFIVQNYEPGDHLYLFGFSRGAYTVRSLAGMLYNCGVLQRIHAHRIPDAFELYKDRNIHPQDPQSMLFRAHYAVNEEVRVRFIGAFDTVGALGVPLRMLGWLNEKHLFHDTELGPNVEIARHALALDERRQDFVPALWQASPIVDLKQVWFAGVHSDIGGGYHREPGSGRLSDIPLGWMAREAQLAGLEVESHLFAQLDEDPLAPRHEEYDGFYRLLGEHQRTLAPEHRVHASVRQRHLGNGYAPSPLLARIDAGEWGELET
ncbi:DUF2235 domain-containing protein [Ferrimonas balearica]|uniref:DUF2235 domain-containing protein n=1 Tax=Ferrimonas balearica TaxID=44012 RepID=UPI001F2164A9|nr:DUF2235 domain-containing protein [Ferrimonas balearica]MBY6016836.1 DUF2235 domain-containing protein [Halomonas denitrificans]MBY6094874.1 DUF2235 domain-containing protein [Ferrimonas balearica]